jgi:uncharacterized membrane protein YjjP (DUF1212 family)
MRNDPTLAHGTSWTGWTPAGGLPLPTTVSNADPRIAFVLRLGRALHNSGYDAQRLEEALSLASDRLGLTGQFFSTPTSIMAGFGPQDDQRTFLLRVEPGESNLGKLAQVDEVTRDVLNGRVTPAEGIPRLETLENAPPLYGPWLTTLAFGIASGSAARFFGGGWQESLTGLIIGLVTGGLALGARQWPALGRVFEPVAALVASFIAASMAIAGLHVSVFLATLAGVIVLIPGLMVTTALTELSTRHLASGTARFMGALVLLMGIVFGIALGTKLASLTLGVIPQLTPEALPPWTLLISLVVTPLAFVVLLKAELRDAPWIVIAGALSYLGARIGGRLLGPELGAFGGAVVTGIASAWYAKIANRPSQIALVPGLLLLVPGSIGLRSFASLVERDVLIGVEGAFQMILIAVALVSGILIARIISPRRPLLE